MRSARTVLVLAAFALVVSACSSSVGTVTVDDPWGRPSPSSAENAAFYMTLVGGTETDTLTGASSAACMMTEVHETTMKDGQMSMAPVDGGVVVRPGETVVLEPGGLHVMCMGIVEPLTAGDTVEVELSFASGETTTITAGIRDE